MKYQALSPDEIPINFEKYNKREEALKALKTWSKKYEKQGYYSSNEGRISLECLIDECYIVEVLNQHHTK